jgi:hypothetical protein
MIMSLVAAELLKLGFRNAKNLKIEDVERVAKAIGLKPTVLLGPSLGVLGVGVALGAGIGMLAAPCSGKELRDRVLKTLRTQRSGSNGLGAGHNGAESRVPEATPGVSTF